MNRPDCFTLALIELEREGILDNMNSEEFADSFIDRAKKIRNYLIRYRSGQKRADKRWSKK